MSYFLNSSLGEVNLLDFMAQRKFINLMCQCDLCFRCQDQHITKIAKQVTDWLSVVDECKIQSSTQSISESLKSVELEEDEVIVSFDVTSLYTNVPVHEAIDICTELLFSGKYQLPPVNKNTFKTLLTISSSNVLILAHDGYYRQRDGLAMGIPPAPPLAKMAG